MRESNKGIVIFTDGGTEAEEDYQAQGQARRADRDWLSVKILQNNPKVPEQQNLPASPRLILAPENSKGSYLLCLIYPP